MRNLDEFFEGMREATPEETAVVRDYIMQNMTDFPVTAAYSVTMVCSDESVVYLFKTLHEAIKFLEDNFNTMLAENEMELLDYDIAEDHTRACIETLDEVYMIFVGQIYK